MHTANAHSPDRSPTVLLTPRADSANADAHWLIACSQAPEQTIRTMNSQKSGCDVRDL